MGNQTLYVIRFFSYAYMLAAFPHNYIKALLISL